MIPEYLSAHALKNVWGVPYQDHQAIIALNPLSPKGGDITATDVMWESVSLPTAKDRYYIYQIGGNGPDRLALPHTTREWFRLTDWGMQNRQVIDLYTQDGIHLPLSAAYIYRQENGNYVIAIKAYPANWAVHLKDMVNYDVDQVYIRLYRNDWLQNNSISGVQYPVAYGGGLLMTRDDITMVTRDIRSLALRSGLTKVFRNGYYVDQGNLSKIEIGDIVEYVYDGSVDRVIDFDLSQLQSYDSVIDKAAKYLLHPPKDPRGNLVRYRDDVDVYLYVGDSDIDMKGLYFHRNSEDSLRMVTHADYGLKAEYIANYQERLTQVDKDIKIQIHVRNGGNQDYLVPEHHRIARLYQFDDAFIYDAMIGPDALVSDWRAENLESSLYTALMRNYDGAMDANDVAWCYGLNACGLLLADSPKPVVADANGNYVEVGIQLRAGSTAFEYDDKGVLLGYRQYAGGERYYPQASECALVEFQTGYGQKSLDWHEGVADLDIPTNYRYQLYYCSVKNKVPQYDWQPAKEGTHYALTEDGKIHWTLNPSQRLGLMVTDKNFLLYSVTLESVSHLWSFTIAHSDVAGTPLTLQPKRLAINLNGYWLLEGVHCVVNWPVVHLTSDRYLRTTGPQRITVMGTGFCDSKTMVRTQPQDAGWVKQGVLSVNDTYGLRGDRVTHAVVDGRTYLPGMLPWAEVAVDGDTTGYPRLFNGMPYFTHDVVVPLREYSEQVNAGLLRVESETDKAVADYLQTRAPAYQQDGPNPITAPYPVHSVFMTAVIGGLKDGTVFTPYKPLDELYVSDAVTALRPLLDFDVAHIGVNTNYVEVKPWPYASGFMTVTRNTYQFLEKLNHMYLRDLVPINRYFRIGESNLYEGF